MISTLIYHCLFLQLSALILLMKKVNQIPRCANRQKSLHFAIEFMSFSLVHYELCLNRVLFQVMRELFLDASAWCKWNPFFLSIICCTYALARITCALISKDHAWYSVRCFVAHVLQWKSNGIRKRECRKENKNTHLFLKFCLLKANEARRIHEIWWDKI